MELTRRPSRRSLRAPPPPGSRPAPLVSLALALARAHCPPVVLALELCSAQIQASARGGRRSGCARTPRHADPRSRPTRQRRPRRHNWGPQGWTGARRSGLPGEGALQCAWPRPLANSLAAQSTLAVGPCLNLGNKRERARVDSQMQR